MKLRLKRVIPGFAGNGRRGDGDLLVDVAKGEIGRATFLCDDLVSAELELNADEVGREYFLQIGGCPDSRPYLVADEHVGVFRFEMKPRNRSDLPYVFKLFQSTIGVSLLFLGEARYDVDGIKRVPLRRIAQITVVDEIRSEAYDKMVKSLLDDDLPHFCVDDFNWQMAKNQFSLNWENGYTSYQNPSVMLLELAKIVRKVAPYVDSVLRAPRMNFQLERVKKRLASVDRIDAQTRKAIFRAELRNGSNRFERIQSVKVDATGKCPTYDIPAHRAIKTFLKSVNSRLLVIEADFNRRLDELGADIDEKARVWNRRSAKNMVADDRAAIDGIRRKLQLGENVRRTVLSMLSSNVMREARAGVSIFDVAWAEFSATSAYQKLYELILQFSRSCYWWVGDKQVGSWTVPALELSENGETFLQQKYSTVYENWCYAQLLKGFFRAGYDCIEGRFIQNENGSRCKFIKDGVEVSLIHGVKALESSRRGNVEFEVVTESDFGMTPDFAMLVREIGRTGCAWVVLDAKSDNTMRLHMLKARNKYASGICYVERGRRIMPFASMLLRSGERDSEYPEVEIPPPQCVGANDAHDIEDRIRDHSDDDYCWNGYNGIVEGERKMPPYHGHLRVNVKSLGYDEEIFRRFVCGLVATARRELKKTV